jgi:hypothetical protein
VADDRPTPRRTGAAALALRLAGAGYDEVADALGLANAQVARDHAERALEARAWDDVEGRDRMRAENGARLERLLRGVWAKATNPDHPEHLAAVKVAREVIDRHCRLYGLDAPAEVIVHTPTANEIDQWVAGMIAMSAADLRGMEPPIIDAELAELSEP